jgi:hypothetical protein
MREDRNFKASDVSGPSIWIFILCENLRTGLQLWNENRRDEAACFLKQGANASTKMALEFIKANCEYKKSMKISSRAPNRLNYWNIF